MFEDTMKPDMQGATSRSLAEEMVRILYQKGARDLIMYEASEEISLTDYHIIATGRSSTHVKSLADDLEYEMGLRGVPARAMEGRDSGAWVLVDYFSVIVHVFDEASRSYYNLERLQNQEKLVDITALLPQEEE